MHAKHTLGISEEKMDTSIRISEDTYKNVVKARGALEQTFGRRLSLDETTFIASSYVNIAYEEFQKLEQQHLLKAIVEKDGSVEIRWTQLGKIVSEVLPRLMSAFGNLKLILDKKSLTVKMNSGHVS